MAGARPREPSPAGNDAETDGPYRRRTMDVAMVRWPAEHARCAVLRAMGQPRLLLVESGPPPVLIDVLEDWIRVPASDEDVHAREGVLRRRAAIGPRLAPELDDDGVLRVGDHWVSLPPVEARLTQALIARFGAVVSRDALGRAGWPAGSPGRNALDVHMLRLRRRLAPLALAIRTVRSRGYLLEHGVDARVNGSAVISATGT
jgi:hypothetical protein